MAYDRAKYINDYSKDHYRCYNFRVSKELDADIIECIETAKQSGISINAFIRECIRASMKDEKVLNEALEKSEIIRQNRI